MAGFTGWFAALKIDGSLEKTSQSLKVAKTAQSAGSLRPKNYSGGIVFPFSSERTNVAGTNAIRGGQIHRWLASMLVMLGFIASGWTNAQESEFSGLIRTKLPDRGSYRAPQVKVGIGTAEPAKDASRAAASERDFDEQADQEEEFVDREEGVQPSSINPIGRVAATESPSIVRPRVRTAGHTQPSRPATKKASYQRASSVQQSSFLGEPSCGWEPGCGLEPACGMEPACGCELSGRACDGSCACDLGACDGYGAQSCGGCGSLGCSSCRARLCLDPCQWFGSIELLMMWRVGDGLPPLVTTSTAANGTGVLGATGTQVLFGNNRVLDDLTAGGRLTIGTWLDDGHCHSLVFRGWSATKADYDFRTDQTDNPIIARPFFNVTDGVAAANGSQVIASPNLREGSVQIHGSNEVFGGDVSLRQPWVSGLGGHIDFLYGYQYMRMNDSLRIATNSLELPPAQATVLDVVDSFNAQNEFHGGQLGWLHATTRVAGRSTALSKLLLVRFEEPRYAVAVKHVHSAPTV